MPHDRIDDGTAFLKVGCLNGDRSDVAEVKQQLDHAVDAMNRRSVEVALGASAIRAYRDWETDRKSTRLNSSHSAKSRMPSSA